ncbi:repressor LexA [Marinitoga hydrogenitolerans DSM 16785]|uniref:Repressor LexA n=1 Tax=Marinitoga hydrogenitolerans (strain DSM 16785 / JCM 12826 / AT1271) TaxID=1122195 RepID=A0A1M4Z5P5_MARH1|nr:hypothetical protein [Marinitoga hydrogenitolerans]SHF13393.1 repressor LexA [Marinitoga hydrogenitolerans DSM 16785]
MKNITEKQKKILEYINFYIQIKGYPPSMREIREYFELKSVSTIHAHLKALEKKGYIELSGNSRGIKVLNKKDFGIIEINGEYGEDGKIVLYNKPFYIKCIFGIKLIGSENILNIILKSDFKNYKKNTLLILDRDSNVLGTINIKEVMIDENSYWF